MAATECGDHDAQTGKSDCVDVLSFASSSNCPTGNSRSSLMRKLAVVPACRQVSACAVGQITFTFPRVPAREEGRFAIVTNVEHGMRWAHRSAA